MLVQRLKGLEKQKEKKKKEKEDIMTVVAPMERMKTKRTGLRAGGRGRNPLPQPAVLQRTLWFSSSRKCLSSRKMRGRVYGDGVIFFFLPMGKSCDILVSLDRVLREQPPPPPPSRSPIASPA